jgi:DNA-binding CsgD family transcriptional regulator
MSVLLGQTEVADSLVAHFDTMSQGEYEYDAIGELDYFQNQNDSVNYQRLRSYLDNRFESESNGRGVRILMNFDAIHAIRAGNLTQAKTILKEAIQKCIEAQDTLGWASNKTMMGNVHYFENDYKEAIHHWSEAVQLNQALQDSMRMVRALSNMGAAYLNISYVQSAYEHFKKAIDLRPALAPKDDSYYISQINMAVCQISLKNYDAANAMLQAIEQDTALSKHVKLLLWLNKSEVAHCLMDYDSFESSMDSVEVYIDDQLQYKPVYLETRAIGYLKFGKPEQASQWMDLYYQEIGEQYNEEDYVNLLINYADYLHHYKDELLSDSLVDSWIALTDSSMNSSIRISLYQIKSDMNARDGNYKEAYDYLSRVDSLKDIQVDSAMYTTVLDYGELYRNHWLKGQNETLSTNLVEKEELLSRAQWMNLMAAIFILVTLISIVWVYLNWKKEQKLRTQLREVNTRERALKERELEQLKEELAQQEHELHQTATLLLKARKVEQDFLELIKKNKENLENKDYKKIMMIEGEARNLSHIHDEFTMEQSLKKNLKPFLDRLSEQFSDLTNSEKMVCSLIRLGYKTKDIASLLNKSEKSIENFRSRARKKMNISSDTSLQEELLKY